MPHVLPVSDPIRLDKPAAIFIGGVRPRAGGSPVTAGPFQLAQVTELAGARGTQVYAEDMQRMMAVLGTTPHTFPWGIATLLVLGLLAWCAALAAAWIYLKRRGQSRQIADSEPDPALESELA
jgi:hypothetical protein